MLHCKQYAIFQSTLSARRATIFQKFIFNKLLISIHALREESDILKMTKAFSRTRFQSTLSARRATYIKAEADFIFYISIHALREESDPKSISNSDRSSEFQSTLSARRATLALRRLIFLSEFQSTLSARRATVPQARDKPKKNISIHALREESDSR